MVEEESSPGEVRDLLALSESPLAQGRQEGVVRVLAKPGEPKRFTNLPRRYSIKYSKASLRSKVIEAIKDYETAGGEKDFKFPDVPEELLEPDWHLKVSEGGKMLDLFKHVSHLSEGSGGGQKVGWFGRKK